MSSSPYGRDKYGPERLKLQDGPSIFSQMRAVIASPLSNVKSQKPIVKWSKPDSARLRAKECVTRLRLAFRRVK